MIRLVRSPRKPVTPRTSRGSEQRLPNVRISFPVRVVRLMPVRRLPLN